MGIKKNKRKAFLGKSRVKLLLIFLLLLITISIAFLLKSPKSHVILLTEKGFVPENITIRKGDRVIFRTETGKDFWPASNVHPTHDIYKEFDAKKPISPGKDWSFVFNKVGRWRFHDHLNEYAVGEIVVLGGERDNISLSDCLNATVSGKSKCYEDVIYETLDEKGIYDALEMVGAIYASGDPYLVDCHGLLHEVGRRAYMQFSEGKDFRLSSKTSYCGYGFYHGFMEEMLHTSGDIEEARKFCDFVEGKLKEEKIDAGGACYHGIGHGVVEDEPPPNLWGNAQAIIDQGLTLCARVANNEYIARKCGSGVFNAYEILATKELYNLRHDPDDFFAICHTQSDILRGECYQQLTVPLKMMIGNDYIRGAEYIDDRIKDDTEASLALLAVVVERARSLPDDYLGAVRDCRMMPERFHMTCLEAYAEGFLKYGPPEMEYEKAIEFCNFDELDEAEKQSCFSHTLSLLRIFYPADKSKKICEGVEEQYRINNCEYY